MSATSNARYDASPRRVLLVLPTWVGDVVMATPFIDGLFRRFPDAKISLLMNRHLYSLLEGSDWVEDCHFWPPRTKSAEARQAHRDLVRLLRDKQFDLAVMLPNSFRSAWLCWRIRARRRVGFNRDGRGLLLTDRVAVPNREGRGYRPMPLVDYYAVLGEYLGMPHPGDGLALFTLAAENERVASRLAAEGFSGKPRVVLCPGASFGASKCWFPERFAGVADRLVREQGAAVVISPGPGEEPLARAIADAMDEDALLLENPCLTLGELKSLIAGADLLLGNDTGPRHFGRAFDIPRVTIFGPTEARWTDTSHAHETIARVEVPCGPCHKKVCPLEEQVCMTRVTVDRVYDACVNELGVAHR